MELVVLLVSCPLDVGRVRVEQQSAQKKQKIKKIALTTPDDV
jgi:hypothetical protein